MSEPDAKLERAIRWHQRVSMVCGFVLALQALGLLAGGIWAFGKIGTPVEMVASAERTVIEAYPKFKAELLARAQRPAATEYGDAPVELDGISGLRSWLARLAVGKLEGVSGRALEYSEERLEKFLTANRPLIEKFLKAKQGTPEADKLADALDAKYGEAFGPQAEAQSQAVLKALRGLNAQLARLAAGDDLTPRELVARRIIRIVTAMTAPAPKN